MAFLISAIVIISIIAAFVLIKKQPQAVVEQPATTAVVEPVVEVEPEVEPEPVATVEEAESTEPAVTTEPAEPVADLQEVKVEPKKKKPATKPVKKDK
jgi:outer membrane biosynthesis protein TonB